MGLDLFCDDYSERVGSYTYVHELRKNWTLASIQYLKDFLQSDECNINSFDENETEVIYEITMKIDRCNNLIKMLEEWCVGHPPFSLLNYSVIIDSDTDLLREFGLNGLHIFVNHSDSDGYITPGESYDILNTLSKICQYLDHRNFNVNNKNIESYYLYTIFKKSAESGQLISFM